MKVHESQAIYYHSAFGKKVELHTGEHVKITSVEKRQGERGLQRQRRVSVFTVNRM
jgi:hypothetical protein